LFLTFFLPKIASFLMRLTLSLATYDLLIPIVLVG
jgi:hypothetical protein